MIAIVLGKNAALLNAEADIGWCCRHEHESYSAALCCALQALEAVMAAGWARAPHRLRFVERTT